MKRKLLTSFFLLSLIFIIMPSTSYARAASYPSILPTETKISVEQGETAQLEFEIFREYNHEKYHVNIYDGTEYEIENGLANIVASVTDDLSGSDLLYHLTTPWDTTDVPPGTYTVECYMSFYSFYEWHDAPHKTRLLKVTIVKPGTSSKHKTSSNTKSKEVNYPVFVNGKKLSFDQSPINEDGHTLVPMRAIFEALGANVSYDSELNYIIAKKDNNTIALKVDSASMTTNGKDILLDVPVIAVDGRTLVPLRAVSEAFQCNVKWDSKTKTISITQ